MSGSLVLAALGLLLPAQQPAEIHVVDSAGKPIAGAEVIRTQSWRMADLPESLLDGHQFPLPEVLGRARTDANGRCRVQLPAASTSRFMPPRSVFFVRARSFRVHCVAVERDNMPAGPVFEVVLTRAAGSGKIKLSLPSGKPAAGRRVRGIGLVSGDGIALLPDELIEDTKSDASGNVDFAELSRVAAIEVDDPKLGRQVATRAWDLGLDDIRLKPATSLSIRVTGKRAAAIAGMRVRIWTTAANGSASREQQVLGYAEAAFDGKGSLGCPAIAPGNLHFSLLGADDAELVPWFFLPGKARTLTKDSKPIECGLLESRLLRGQVIDAATKRGVPGAIVWATSINAHRTTRTDDDGKFAIRVYGENNSVSVVTFPARYRSVSSSFGSRVPKGVTELEPFELELGNVITGRVVDAAGAPIARAFVVGRWTKHTGFGQANYWRAAFSGPDGRFRLEGISPDATPMLTARSFDSKTESPVRPDGHDTVLRLTSVAALTANGIVTSTSGEPIENATVTVETQTVPTGRVVGSSKQAKSFVAVVGADGRWSREVPSGFEYRIHVEARGFAEAGSAWRKLAGTSIDFTTRLKKLVTLEGRVVAGNSPVAGATVLCPSRGIEAKTRADGSFALVGLPAGDALVVVRNRDRYSAHRFAGGQTIDLSRARKRRQAPLVPLAERLVLAEKVIKPSIHKLEATGKLDSDLRLWQLLASVDPAGTLARLETRGLAVPWYNDTVRRSLILALAHESLDEALAVSETLAEPDRKALNLQELAKRCRGPQARRILFEALWSARRIARPDMRLCVLSRIGEGFLDAGDRATALRVFEEAEPLVAKLPNKEWPGYARACFATDTAVIDLGRSLEIVSGMNSNAQQRHYANIAHEIAADDPEACERILAKLDPFHYARAAARVCARMATKDLPRAQRLANKVSDSGLRGFALAAMAEAVGSEQLLDAAFEALHGTRGRTGPCIVAGAIVDIAARIAPERLDDAIARAIALRTPRTTDPGDGWRKPLEEDCALASSLALYDVDLARLVLHEAVETRSYLLTDRNKYDPKLFFGALAVIDPKLAVAAVEEIADDHPQKGYPVRPRMRQTVALTLACRNAAMLRNRTRHLTSLPELEEDQ